MRFTKFLESPETDDIQIKEAVQFYDHLYDFVSKHKNNMGAFQKMDDFGGWLIYAEQIDKKYIGSGLCVLLASEKSRRATITKEVSASASFGYMGKHPIIIIFYLIGDYDANHIDTRLSGTKTSIIHEYIHYLDSLRQKKPQGSTIEKSRERYFNSPDEYNAYYQAGVYELYLVFGDKSKIPIKSQKKLFGNSFEEFFKKISDFGFDEDFLSHLSPTNMRKLKKRLASVYMDIKQFLDNN